MKKLLLATLLYSLSVYGLGQSDSFDFRNDFRPEFNRTLTIEQLAQLQASTDVVVLDVRLTEDYAQDPVQIPGAQYMNPETLPSWITQLDKSKAVVVYCVAGKWVSQKVAHMLEQSGISVQSLEGGLESWKAAQ